MKNPIQRCPLKQSNKQQDTWQFNVGKHKQAIRVIVNLDLNEEPTQDELVNELVRYISAFEEIKQNTTY